MISLKGRFFRWMVGLQNINPIEHPDAVRKMQKTAERYINDKIKSGYTLEKCKTVNGSRYQVIKKRGSGCCSKAIYYLHGGCYVCGLTYNYRDFCIPFCNIDEETEVILLDYDVAPKYKYPTQLNQAADVWNEIINERGIKESNIVVGGDSSGGNLVLALMLKLRDENQMMPAGIFLLSPWTDMLANGKSYEKNYNNDIEIGQKKSGLWTDVKQRILNSDLYCYIGDADRCSPYISPANGDYHGFPPMFIAVGEHEMLLDDSIVVAKKAKATGVKVVLERKPEMFHTYVLYMNNFPESNETYQKLIDYVRSLISGK